MALEAFSECSDLECKSIVNRDDAIGWLKSIAGFANASDGKFYISASSEYALAGLLFYEAKTNSIKKSPEEEEVFSNSSGV